MLNLENAVSRELKHRTKKEVPKAFKHAIRNAINELTDLLQDIGGSLVPGRINRLLHRRLECQSYLSADDEGFFSSLYSLGALSLNGAKHVAVVYIDLTDNYYTITVDEKEKGVSEEVFKLFDRHLTERNPVKGKVINLKGDVINLKTLDWSAIAIPRRFIEELEENVIWPMKEYKSLKSNGSYEPRGVLLAGEPGMGKTVIGRIVAGQVAGNSKTVIMTSPTELEGIGMWKYAFDVAGTLKPTLLYVEDLEKGGSTGKSAMYTLAEHLDGLEDRKDVTIMATTNELDSIDRRLTERPGRIDRILRFDPRETKIFDVGWKKRVLEIHLNGDYVLDADPDKIARLIENKPYSGAHIKDLVTTAELIATKKAGVGNAGNGKLHLSEAIITEAISKVESSYPALRKNAKLGFQT